MDKIFLILFIIFLVLAFFEGNIMIIVAISEKDISGWSEYWILILIAIVIDLILLCLVMARFMPPICSSFQLMRSGLRNHRTAKKESKKLKKLLKSEELDVNRLQELRDKRISESATKRTLHFCQLIENIAGEEQLQDCLSEVREKQGVLDEINDIENRILKVAESCKNAGDIKSCKYYLDILKSAKVITPEITSLENECEEQLLWRERESRAIQLWVKVFLGIFIFIIAVCVRLYITDTPYRELRSMIKDQSLTAEMCSWSSKNSEESYYDYLTSEKGCKLLASELTKLHEDNDVSKAMWLLCIQPDYIDGYHLSASPSFINWIVDYAKTNGARSTNQKDADDSRYKVTYDVNGYRVIINSYEDKASNINVFFISDGENIRTIQVRNRYRKETIPIIE
ncbi:MAG: hypothetical protein K2K70_09975 [Lachnospiraceae bacterium]|nr:hypothetical protein [Lachnospiraceae bacterium]